MLDFTSEIEDLSSLRLEEDLVAVASEEVDFSSDKFEEESECAAECCDLFT